MIISRLITSYILVIIFALFITKYFPQNILHQQKNAYKFSDSLEFLPIVDAFGPESLTFDPNGGGPYAGVSDGRIIKWVPHQRRWINFAFISSNREECEKRKNHEEKEDECGRPLGLRFNEKSGELYIADAYMGLMVVGRDGGLARKLVTEVDGITIGFTNGLDIDQESGLVYFTSSSTLFPRREYMSVILSNDKTGRLLQYNPHTDQTTTLLNNLSFPNGVSLTKNKDTVLIVETTTCQILRFRLQNPSSKSETATEVFTQLDGFPDNIKINSKGEFWVGIYSKRGEFLKWVLSVSWVGKSVVNLPFNGVKLSSIFGRFKAIGMAVKLDEEGKIVKVLEEKSGKLKFVSEVVEKDGDLWFGSVILPFVTLFKDFDSSL
ncbi:hypothetical protein RND81_05G184800 [Saponaria officinalis]|uniref:Strictosidine synthase conserved region domain-containing protein n=1 Tax=Saponaria officinalis TaxID=3572 RepID=A0AAW1KZZ5_SAPOF